MMSYSPYDNVTAKAYPPMLVPAALHDSQVGFHGPHKWVARLRTTKTDGDELLFVTAMNADTREARDAYGAVAINSRVMAWLLTLAR